MTAKEYIIKQAIPFMDGGCCGLDDEQLEWHLNDYATHKSAEDNRELIEAMEELKAWHEKYPIGKIYHYDQAGTIERELTVVVNRQISLIQKHSSMSHIYDRDSDGKVVKNQTLCGIDLTGYDTALCLLKNRPFYVYYLETEPKIRHLQLMKVDCETCASRYIKMYNLKIKS